MDSPEKAVESIREEDGSSPIRNSDSNLFENKEDQKGENFMNENEVPNDRMQVYLDQEYPVSPAPHVGVDSEGLQSPIMKSNSADLSSPARNHGESFLPVESDLHHDDMERRFSDYGTGEQRFSMEDYHSNEKKEGTEDAEPITHSGDFLDNNVNETYNNEFHNEGSYPLAHNSLLTGDNNNCYEMMGEEAFNHQAPKSPALDEPESGDVENAATNFPSDKRVLPDEVDGRSSSPHTEMKEDDYSVVPASENGGMVWENSSPHSPPRTQNASPSPERQFSISAERSRSQQSPHSQPSPREGVQSPANIDKKSATLPSPPRRKHSPSPEKHTGGRKRPSSRDHSSPTRRKSPSERPIQRESHRRDGSPKRQTAPSPRRRDSPRRRGRSTSRSPVRRRDSPGRRRDHHRRSRSRSPHARDRHRRSPPRRRPSPRRRSPPPSHSRRRSPRRPWSPPANRNTGLGKPGNNLFVAGFSYVTTERDLEKKFSRFGRVTDVRIVRDRRSGESRGFGFLSLERDEDADAAIRAVDQTEWNGRIVLVEKSKTSTR